MDFSYLVGRVPDEARWSFLDIVEEGELAQLKALVEHAIATNVDGHGRFERWWHSVETEHFENVENRFGGSFTRICVHDDTYLLRFLRQARAHRELQRRHGLPLMDRSNAHLAWRMVNRRFRQAIFRQAIN